MKYRILLFAALTSLIVACSDQQQKPQEDNKGLLSTDLVNNPRTADGMDPNAAATMPTMDFKDTTHDFGTIKEGEIVTYDFEFTNNGKNPLIISNATGSCGCTAPDYPREPVPPGKTAKINVEFRSAGKFGHQEKSVTLVTNSKRGIHMLYITAEVKKD